MVPCCGESSLPGPAVTSTCTPMKKRSVPSTSAMGASENMFQNMAPFLR